MRREGGWNLIELMVVVVVMGVVGTTLLTVFQTVHEEERYSAACAQDLRGLRRAVARIEDDLREASSIADLDARLTEGDLLLGDERIAENIALFAVEEKDRVARVRIGLGKRSDAPHRRDAVLDFQVRLRGREEKR